jgi:hypothetical protein
MSSKRAQGTANLAVVNVAQGTKILWRLLPRDKDIARRKYTELTIQFETQPTNYDHCFRSIWEQT